MHFIVYAQEAQAKRALCWMGNMKELASNDCGSLIPHFFDLRRVPSRYRQVLPLSIMQRDQCLVVGSAPGVLTVAITNRHTTSTLQTLQVLQQYTGRAIFPVLIDQGRMRLLLQRIRPLQARRLFTACQGSGEHAHVSLSLLSPAPAGPRPRNGPFRPQDGPLVGYANASRTGWGRLRSLKPLKGCIFDHRDTLHSRLGVS